MTMRLVSGRADLLGTEGASYGAPCYLPPFFFLLPVHFYCGRYRRDVIAYQVSACIIRRRMALAINR